MTKFMWFQLISIIVVLGVLVTICVVEDKLVTESLNNVADYCYKIESAMEEKMKMFPIWCLIWSMIGLKTKGIYAF